MIDLPIINSIRCTIINALRAENAMFSKILKQELKGLLVYLNNNPSPIEIRTHQLYNPEGFSTGTDLHHIEHDRYYDDITIDDP